MTALRHPQDASSADPQEIEKFSRMAESWWDPTGPFRPLHKMNPVRLDYVRDQICGQFDRDPQAPRALEGLRILDVGCGGGLLSEPLARMGAQVVGVDAAERNIPVARLHAERMGLEIDYRAGTVEALAEAGELFDAVVCLEVVEHVAHLADFVKSCAEVVRPGGILVASTLARTPQSFAMAIVGAEYLLRWLPRGTHDWRKFVNPVELDAAFIVAGLETADVSGFVYSPFRDSWRRDPRDLSCNYAAAAVKPAAALLIEGAPGALAP